MDQILVDPSDERRILDFRPLGFRDVAVLGRYSYATAHGALEEHSHGEMLEICYMASGEQAYVVDGQDFTLKGGEVFITRPHERHGTGRRPEGKGSLYWLLLFLPKPNARFLSLSPKETRVLADRLLNLPRKFRADNRFKRTLDRVFDAFDRTDDPLRVASLRNLLQRLLLDLIQTSRQQGWTVSPEMQRVQQHIAEQLGEPLQVRDLARLVCLSPSRFKTRFKAEIGVPPADYIARERIERAKEMLRGGQESVTAIAEAVGYPNPQYFATVFKRYTGQTPSRFRDRP